MKATSRAVADSDVAIAGGGIIEREVAAGGIMVTGGVARQREATDRRVAKADGVGSASVRFKF